MKKISLVMTTIGDGKILEPISEQTIWLEAMDELAIIVIPDRKTPRELFNRCDELKKCGFEISCPTITEQNGFLKKLNFSPHLIPYDSDNRRNIGYLMALNQGSEVIVSLDDDNYPVQSIRNYLTVGYDLSVPALYSTIGWINICDLLRMDKDYKVYPRGFPYYKRHLEYEISSKQESGRIGLNLGLWIGDPDFDALTWLSTPTKSISFKGQSFLLGKGMWTPINSQNTAIHRDLMPSYYYIRMGTGIERFGDIFSGYFVQKCMECMGDRVRIGTPITMHKRNKHDFFKDLYPGEIKGILILEELLPWLGEVKLIGSTYAEAYLCLADRLDIQMPYFNGSIWTDEVKHYFSDMTLWMREWVKVCQRIG